MKRSTDGVLSHKYHGFRCDQNGPSVRQLPIGANISGRGTPGGEGALPVRRSLWSDVCSLVGLAKSDPRAPRRRFRSQRYISVLDQGRLWASGTIRRLPDEDAIPPGESHVIYGTGL